MRGWIYDATLLPLTARWYGRVLGMISPGSRVLDIGIGTGGALARNAPLVRAKNLQVVGIDIDEDYLKRAAVAIGRADLTDRVITKRESVEEHAGGPYDAIYFSASFMLLADPVSVLQTVGTLLNNDGTVYFTQTFHDRPMPALERVKPLLGRVTTIEFGRVTYEADFRAAVTAGGFDLLDLVTMEKRGARSYRLGVARPAS